VPLDTTDVTGGPAGASAQGIDCFYVYPTVDTLPNIVPAPSDEEFAQAIAQVGMLAPDCRVFVPTYRQRTLPELALALITKIPPDYSTAFGDVAQAFQYYWDHDNTDPVTGRRRGVVLLGHSQGAAALTALIQNEFDGKPAMRQLVSAILLGGHVVVPIGQPDGGGTDPKATFQHIPACRTATETGCVVAYSSYKPGGQVPASDADLVRVPNDPRHQVLCVNPAALLTPGAGPTPLDTVLYTRKLVGGNDLFPYGRINSLGQSLTVPNYPTGFARYHGTLTGQCRQATDADGTVSWLDITGGDDLIGPPQPNFYGLHALDFNVTAGDLRQLIADQARSWGT
jgi:hypothetical protein